jgi:hypothetical protein
MKSTLDSLGLRQKIAEQQAIEKWREVVGPQIAAVTYVDSVRDGVMFVSCKSSMWASELTLHAPDILKRLEQSVGRKVIRELRFGSRGFKKSQPKESTEGEFEPDRVRLTAEEQDAAARTAAEAASIELAQKIERAILAGKRRRKALESGED